MLQSAVLAIKPDLVIYMMFFAEFVAIFLYSLSL